MALVVAMASTLPLDGSRSVGDEEIASARTRNWSWRNWRKNKFKGFVPLGFKPGPGFIHGFEYGNYGYGGYY